MKYFALLVVFALVGCPSTKPKDDGNTRVVVGDPPPPAAATAELPDFGDPKPPIPASSKGSKER